MLNTNLQTAAQMFVAAVTATPEMDAFLKAKAVFQGDPELCDLRKRFSEQSKEAQAKQNTGTLTQVEIDAIRALQNRVNAHPLTVQFVQARQAMIAQLTECNGVLSGEIGFDFASAAAPQSCCG